MDTLQRLEPYSHVMAQERISNPRYERNSDGEVEFILKINLSEFQPDEIQIDQEGLSVKIDAAKPISPYTRQRRYKEYHKLISLPQKSDLTKKMKAFYEDNKLIIKMPIVPQYYSSSAYRKSRDNFSPLSIQSEEIMTLYTHNVQIDHEFEDGIIAVNVVDYMVHVSVTKEHSDSLGASTRQELHREHQFPSTVIIESLKAELNGNVLTLSAPYKSRYDSLRSNRTIKSTSSSFH